MALKIAVAGKTQAADDAHDSSGVSVQALGHGAHTEKDVFARMFENRANNLLALGAEEFDALRERRSRGLQGERVIVSWRQRIAQNAQHVNCTSITWLVTHEW